MYRPDERQTLTATGKIKDAGEYGWFLFALSKYPTVGVVSTIDVDNSDDGSGEILYHWQVTRASSVNNDGMKHPMKYTDGLYATLSAGGMEIVLYLWPGMKKFPRN